MTGGERLKRTRLISLFLLLAVVPSVAFASPAAAVSSSPIQLSGQPFETTATALGLDSSVVLGAPEGEIGDPSSDRETRVENGVLVFADNGMTVLSPDGTQAICDPQILERALDDDSVDIAAYMAQYNCYLPSEAVEGFTELQGCNDISETFSYDCTVGAAIDGVTGLAENIVDGIFEDVITSINNALREGFANGVEFLFGTVLGGTGEASADNDFQRGFAAPNLNTSWFGSQMDLTRQIAMYLIAPLFMLAVIQSILKGSLFFLVRAGLIMLPISIFGGVIAVEFTRRLLWISDDFSHFIASTAINDSNNWLSETVEGYAGTAFTLFEALWFLVGLLAFIVIYAELIIRELGIYLAVFFMPLGFAALVWPSSAKFARRLVELLIGLIFSKVFIVAVLSMGVAALGSTDRAVNTGVGGAGDIANLTAAVAIFFMAAFAGMKVIDISSASSAAEGRLTSPGNIYGKGHVLGYGLGKLRASREKKATDVEPKGKDASRALPVATPTAAPASGRTPTPDPASAYKGKPGGRPQTVPNESGGMPSEAPGGIKSPYGASGPTNTSSGRSRTPSEGTPSEAPGGMKSPYGASGPTNTTSGRSKPGANTSGVNKDRTQAPTSRAQKPPGENGSTS